MSARLVYAVILLLALPYLLLHLAVRGWRQRAYWQHLGERFGRYRQQAVKPVIWLHAVSVGETRAAAPLIEALQAHYPDYRILLTHTTPTGRATGKQLFGESVWRVYLPYDYPFAVKRFVRHFKPALGMLMETEIWPNLILTCRRERVPLMLVNARMSLQSARRYRWLAVVTEQSLSALSAIAAQTEADAECLRQLGGRRISIMGNLKFDSTPPLAQIQLGEQWRAVFGGRPVWLAASTRAGEEALVLEAWRQLQPSNALLIIVPRHPQRFDEVAKLLELAAIPYQRRSSGEPVASATQVWLGDSMGELFAYYRAAQVALIGGSLLPLGGQNLIEAAAVGCPVILGPYMWNFAEASRAATASGAALQIGAAEELAGAVSGLLGDPARRAAMSAAAIEFSRAHRGATDRLLALVASFI
ncbi:MAG TPA: lipid IV(A) 3-deoxy-D-manno-octulosonic acid transferase [Burkholderiales bacterium]|nr:lipid IV(A) 3-deoxy-D-manno-octulosonic acid transferase [Burkholderiales bacterium]